MKAKDRMKDFRLSESSLMYGYGHRFATYTVPVTQLGFLHGDGGYIQDGGPLGDHIHWAGIMHVGRIFIDIFMSWMRIEWLMHIVYTYLKDVSL